MSASLFARLRQAYPAAELGVSLLTIHNDEYVVLAEIRVEGALIASALAADRAVETADDRACRRALERLELDTSDQALPLSADPADGSPPANSALGSSVDFSSRPAARAPSSPPPPAVEELSSAGNGAQEMVAPLPAALKTGQTSVELKELPPEQASTPIIKPAANPEAPAPEPLMPPAGVTSEAGSDRTEPESSPGNWALAAPVDLSDVIVQTDVELSRLGWGVSEGREFLERTYGKRSRHDLTDEELLEFLLYLESQPSP